RPGAASVPAVGEFVGPCCLRGAVRGADVADAPDDLRVGVSCPVQSGCCHLYGGQRLGDAERAGGRVVGGGVPAGFSVPEQVQVGELAGSPGGAGEGLGEALLLVQGGGGGQEAAWGNQRGGDGAGSGGVRV